jgi:beta-N-acetylhexosaminidase
VAGACRRLSDAALSRAEAALAARTSPQPVDIAALDAEFAALTGGGAGG